MRAAQHATDARDASRPSLMRFPNDIETWFGNRSELPILALHGRTHGGEYLLRQKLHLLHR